jgi:hypothetical protein
LSREIWVFALLISPLPMSNQDGGFSTAGILEIPRGSKMQQKPLQAVMPSHLIEVCNRLTPHPGHGSWDTRWNPLPGHLPPHCGAVRAFAADYGYGVSRVPDITCRGMGFQESPPERSIHLPCWGPEGFPPLITSVPCGTPAPRAPESLGRLSPCRSP